MAQKSKRTTGSNTQPSSSNPDEVPAGTPMSGETVAAPEQASSKAKYARTAAGPVR
jgi:hypothetical protein